MLNRTSIEAALPVAQRLDERALRVLPNDNTPLMSLLLSIDSTMVANDLGENCDLVSVLQTRANSEAHRLAKADIIKLASASVCRLHEIVRSDVLPKIKEIAAAVQEHVNVRRIAAVLPYSIVMKEVPAVYTNVTLKQIADRYPVPSNIDVQQRDMAPITLDRLKELCKTGMAGFDGELDVILSLENDRGYSEVLSVLIGTKAVHEIHVDYLPGVLVVGQALYDEPEPGVNMSLAEYNERMNRILGRAAHLCRGALTRYQESEKLGTLYSADGRNSITTIVVMGKAYRKMLEAGLTPEALIGNEMTGRRFTQGQLIENKAALEQAYSREMGLRALKVQAEMAGIVREAIGFIVQNCILADDLGEASAQASATLREMVSKINQHNCDNLNQLVTEVVCMVFYPKTDAITFIRLMNRVGATLDSDTDPREVALMATFKYVNHWLCRQIGLIDA
jgi:hypothetical protein